MDLFIAYPVVLIIIPGLMDLRGDVYGAIGYRLTKGLHLGLTQPKLLTKYNLVNIATGYVNSIVVTFFLCLMGIILSLAIKLSTPDLVSLLFIASFSTLTVFAALTPAITAAIVYLFKRGHDPSPFVAIIVTGIGDVLTPAVLITMAYLHNALPSLLKTLFVIAASVLAATLFAHVVRINEGRDLLENLLSSIIGSSGSSLGGFFLTTAIRFVSENPEVIGVLPAFNAVIGAAMGYLSNSFNIDLHIGVEKPERAFYRKSLVGSIATYTSILIALIATSTSSLLTPLKFLRIALGVTMSCLALYFISAFITYLLTTISFRHGWDPDNIVFPIMTTFVDLMGPVVLLITTSLLLAL